VRSFILWAIYTSPYTRRSYSLLSIQRVIRGGNEICVRVSPAGQPVDLHRFWDGAITSSSDLSRQRNAATEMRNRTGFVKSQLSELLSTNHDAWAKESSRLQRKLLTKTGG